MGEMVSNCLPWDVGYPSTGANILPTYGRQKLIGFLAPKK